MATRNNMERPWLDGNQNAKKDSELKRAKIHMSIEQTKKNAYVAQAQRNGTTLAAFIIKNSDNALESDLKKRIEDLK